MRTYLGALTSCCLGHEHPRSMSLGKSQKPYLDRELLKNHGIEFRERTTTVDKLEPWLTPLFHYLTRMPDQFPKKWMHTFRKELKWFEEQGQDRNHADRKTWCIGPIENSTSSEGRVRPTTSVKKTHDELTAYAHAAYDMVQCRKKNENEPKWMSILITHIFLDYAKANGESNSYE